MRTALVTATGVAVAIILVGASVTAYGSNATPSA
jgi:hypothetical protein